MELLIPKNFRSQEGSAISGTFDPWNFHSFRSHEPSFPGMFIPKNEISMELSFPNYMIIILCDLNPKCVGLQASAGDLQGVTSCDPFNQWAPHAGMH